MKIFQVPHRNIDPNNNFIDWLNDECPCDWDGDGEGILFHVRQDLTYLARPGDYVLVTGIETFKVLEPKECL